MELTIYLPQPQTSSDKPAPDNAVTTKKAPQGRKKFWPTEPTTNLQLLMRLA